jgi:hypothetical protein
MSRLNDEHYGNARRALAYERLYLPAEAPVIVANNDALYEFAADTIGKEQPVTYVEFGVAGGVSFRKMVRLFTNPDARFVGFDSFEGLPESWKGLAPGAFSTQGNVPDIDDKRVRFVKGWFQNTFHDSLAWLAPRLGRPPVLVHFDADLYYSTLFLLTSLWPHCAEYYFVMDDFMVDDIVASHDFSLSYPVEIGFLGRVKGPVPHTAFARMARPRRGIMTPQSRER